VSVKVTPEICINKASSYSRLTAAGRETPASNSHSQTCLQTLFFFSPYLWWDNNQTTPACWKTYWNCIAFELGTSCGVFIFVCVVLFCFLPLLWNNDRTTSETPSPGLEAKNLTPKLLRLKLYCIWTWRFFFHLFIFYFYFYFCFLFFIFNPLSISLMPVQFTVDYYTISPYLYLWNFVCLFCFFYLFICFSLFL
jgi:hypothetical protein